jgi:2-dehydro-3-deoxyphosphogluconate aldolase/(4S)-4-hydroxy-2-oxoglutarate aldolase
MTNFNVGCVMNLQDRVAFLREQGIVAIVRADSSEGLVRVVEAVAAGGVRCIEVTMTTPGALDCLRAASEQLAGKGVLLGVGSVLDAETAAQAIAAGAEYVVSPNTSKAVIEAAHAHGCPALPGAFTPNEIVNAWQLGGDLIKVFPATLGGLEYIQAVRAPLPHIPLVPTGGITAENLHEFVSAGVAAVGVGTALVSKKLVAAGDFAGLTANAERFARALAAARGVG